MTTDIGFEYTAVLPAADADRPSSVIASLEVAGQPLRAVVWSARHHAWIYAPGPAARILYDDQKFDRINEIDRAAAERIARDALGTELPSEESLRLICEEGELSGSSYGPPLP